MNFSTSNIWNNSLALRYPIDKIKKIGDLYFYEDSDVLICQHFFEFTINDNELNYLKNEILNSKKVKFNYINESKLLAKIKKWAEDNDFIMEIIDSWDAPKLILNCNPMNYLKNNSNTQIKRNYKNYQNNKNRYKFYNSNYDDKLKLWNYVLYIDFYSWKKAEKSDMKNLNREDLQYLPYLLLENEKSSLIVVCDLDDNPLAYSLMFKDDNCCWYAVKWGASVQGRKKYAGFLSLFNHLEYLYEKEKKIYIDFWGRRNQTYDYLKNQSIIRNHIMVYKKED